MIKLFVSDLDGTLLGKNHAISKRNAQAIRQLEEAGIEFMVATGRTYDSACSVLTPHQLKCRMINLNGAAMYDEDGQIQHTIPLDLDTASDIFEYASLNNLNYSIMSQDHFYVDDREAFIDRITRLLQDANDKYGEDADSNVQFVGESVEELSSYDIENDHPPLKIMILSHDQEALRQFKETFDGYHDIDITSSAPDNLEVTHYQAQKGLAIQSYVQSLGYSMDEVAAIGDSLNDRSMLQMAGYSFAMENASDEVKAIADRIAPHHGMDGVAVVIEEFLDKLQQQ